MQEKRKDCYLIVDDDVAIRQSLADFLARYDIDSCYAADAREARKLLTQRSFNLITLDVLMPGENGIELLKWIKERFDIPVILLTSLDESVDKIIGLEVGADDYLCKPYDPRELLARAKAILRRSQREKTKPEESKVVFYIGERALKLDGQKHNLANKEFLFIELMLEAEGSPVSREQLYQKLFDRSWCPEDRAVDNLVVRLRQKIEPDTSTPRYIITHRHKGYFIPKGVITISI